MDIEIKSWLYDILKAITEIESFFVDRPKDFAAYQNDLRTRRAVERNIEIIGEAVNRILSKDDFPFNYLIQEKLLTQETGLYMAMILFQMKLSGV